MKGIVMVLALAMIGASCEKKDSVAPACSIEATVKDLKPSLDGCDFVFELADGTRLIPERRTYIQAPSQQDDPIYYFQLKDGEKVTISYRETQLLGVCMAGKIVFVTCIAAQEKAGE